MAVRRTSAPLLAVGALVALVGCGGNEPETSAVGTTTAPTVEATAASASPVPEETASSGEPTPAVTNGLSRPDGPIEGVIIAFPQDDDTIEVVAIKEDGEQTLLAEFGAGVRWERELSKWPIDLQTDFTPDYSRMVASDGNGLGWYEADGEFVNVTGSMPQSTGDFGSDIGYDDAWFDEEGNFHFGSYEETRNGNRQTVSQRYMIPAGEGPDAVQDMGAAPKPKHIEDKLCELTVEGELTRDDPWCTRARADVPHQSPGRISDWISDTEFISLSEDGGIFRDVIHPESTYREGGAKRITPAVDRQVHSAVLSPDKTRIVFLSPEEDPSLNPDTSVELFVVPADGSAAPELGPTFPNSQIRVLDWR